MTNPLSPKDFQIQNLKRIVEERDAEIVDLNIRLKNVTYFATVHWDSVRKVMERDMMALKKAVAGDIEKPVLREIKDEGRAEL